MYYILYKLEYIHFSQFPYYMILKKNEKEPGYSWINIWEKFNHSINLRIKNVKKVNFHIEKYKVKWENGKNVLTLKWRFSNWMMYLLFYMLWSFFNSKKMLWIFHIRFIEDFIMFIYNFLYYIIIIKIKPEPNLGLCLRYKNYRKLPACIHDKFNPVCELVLLPNSCRIENLALDQSNRISCLSCWV